MPNLFFFIEDCFWYYRLISRHEVVNINLSSKPVWLLNKNADGTVPILELNAADAPNSNSDVKSTVVLG